jgi:hypothetical protein
MSFHSGRCPASTFCRTCPKSLWASWSFLRAARSQPFELQEGYLAPSGCLPVPVIPHCCSGSRMWQWWPSSWSSQKVPISTNSVFSCLLYHCKIAKRTSSRRFSSGRRMKRGSTVLVPTSCSSRWLFLRFHNLSSIPADRWPCQVSIDTLCWGDRSSHVASILVVFLCGVWLVAFAYT